MAAEKDYWFLHYRISFSLKKKKKKPLGFENISSFLFYTKGALQLRPNHSRTAQWKSKPPLTHCVTFHPSPRELSLPFFRPHVHLILFTALNPPSVFTHHLLSSSSTDQFSRVRRVKIFSYITEIFFSPLIPSPYKHPRVLFLFNDWSS